MSVVHGNSEKQFAAGEKGVPDLFHRRLTATADVVDERVSVEDLEEAMPFDLLEIVDRDRPSVVRMIDVRDAFGGADRVDVALHDIHNRFPTLWRHETLYLEAVD